MHIWSTCTACGEALILSDLQQQLHPTCQTTFPTGDPLVDRFLDAATRGDDELADRLQAQIDAHDQRPRSLPRAAEQYARWGWPVFPLKPGSKEPYPGSKGCKDATTDLTTIRRWWQKAPRSNIGLATGHVFDVLDVDFVTKDTGRATGAAQEWRRLLESGHMPDIHGLATTPRGGIHAYLLPTGGGNKAGFLPGLDYRGAGGYVVAPPSTVGGRRYTWWHLPSPTITTPAASTSEQAAA